MHAISAIYMAGNPGMVKLGNAWRAFLEATVDRTSHHGFFTRSGWSGASTIAPPLPANAADAVAALAPGNSTLRRERFAAALAPVQDAAVGVVRKRPAAALAPVRDAPVGVLRKRPAGERLAASLRAGRLGLQAKAAKRKRGRA